MKATLGITNLGSGKGKNKVGFNRNAPLHIDGGSGFNTFILEGTEINDQFVVYVDDDGVQQIKGAGVDMGSIQNVQNIQINAIDGDDTIYIYGVNAETRLTVNAGRGNDTIQIGGPALLFNPDSQSIDLDTTAPTALVPTVVYEEVEEFVPGFTRVERIANPDGTETVRQIAVPGYTRIKKIATVAMVPVSSTTQSERKRVPPDTARIAAQYDLSAFDNLVTIDGSAGADVVDVKLYGNTDGDRANGEFGVTTAREIQARALKAIYGQSYVPSEDELIPVDSPDNETFGWLTGFGGNSQGIVLDNNELVRIQLGNASNNMILSGVDRDIEYVVLSMGGGDDTVRVGAMSEIVDRISMLKTNLADYSVEVQDWFIDEIAEADRDKVLKQAAYDEVEATAAALEAWYAGLDVSGIDTALLATDLAEQQRLNGKFIADLDPALRDWFTGYESVLARINATAQDLLFAGPRGCQGSGHRRDSLGRADHHDLDAWFAAINFREFADNLPALQAKWERANPRHAGTVGSIREHPVAGADHRRQQAAIRSRSTTPRAPRPFWRRSRCLLGQAVPACRPLGGDVRTDRGRPAAAAHRLYPNSLCSPGWRARPGWAQVALNSFENSYVYLGAANDKVEVKAPHCNPSGSIPAAV